MVKFLAAIILLLSLLLASCTGVAVEAMPVATALPVPTVTVPVPEGGLEVAREERFSFTFGNKTFSYVYWTSTISPEGVYGENLRTLACKEGFFAVVASGYSGNILECEEALLYMYPVGDNFRIFPTTRFAPGVVTVWKH